MKKLRKASWFLGTILASYLALSSPTYANEQKNHENTPKKVETISYQEKEKPYLDTIFTKDRISLQTISGLLYSPCGLGPKTPQFNYAQTNLRLGWMINNPAKLSILPRGNLEAIFEISNSLIHKGFGNYLTGATLLLRYNIVPEKSKLSPYLQLGAGMVYTNAHEDQKQQAIGQAIEFTPQGSIGLRYLISKNLSIDGELMFHHISNASLAKRNEGINALGGFIGFTYFFDKPKK